MSYKTVAEHQRKLAHYCSKNEFPEDLPGIRKEHITHYRRLVFNVIKDALTTAYPLTKKLLGNKGWADLVHDFFSNHHCAHPQVWRMPKELHTYLSSKPEHELNQQFPFLLNLLWFEWIEIEIHTMPDIETTFNTQGNIETDPLVLNPESDISHFNYPVFNTPANEVSEDSKSDYFLLTHRLPETGKVIFTSLTPLHTYILESLLEESLNLNELITNIEKDFKTTVNESAKKEIKSFLKDSLDKTIILGYKEKSEGSYKNIRAF